LGKLDKDDTILTLHLSWKKKTGLDWFQLAEDKRVQCPQIVNAISNSTPVHSLTPVERFYENNNEGNAE